MRKAKRKKKKKKKEQTEEQRKKKEKGEKKRQDIENRGHHVNIFTKMQQKLSFGN